MTRLEEIVREFRDADRQGMIELLRDYSEDLPEVPGEILERMDRDAGRVDECETPVFILVETQNGAVRIFADVPGPDFPTVKGLVSILVNAFDGLSTEEIEAAPADFISSLGLVQLLGMRRIWGISAVYSRIRDEVRRCGETS